MKAETAGVLAPPPLIYAVPLVASIAAEKLLNGKQLPRPFQLLSIGCFASAVSLVATGFMAFKKAGTPVDPFEETTALVEGGPYEHTRNPLYLGLTLTYVGVALAARRRAPLAVLPAILWIMNNGVIAREERYLEQKFGKPYRKYMERVPRWL